MRARLTLVAVAAFVVAGCGGGGGGGTKTGAKAPAGASLIPADVPVYFAVTTDENSSQWEQADALLKKFPGREKLLAEARKELSSEGVNFQRDVLPALGPEVDFALFDLADAEASLVGLTKPEDPEKLMELLKKGDDPPQIVKKRDDGWVVFSDSQASVDRIGASGAKLADDSRYKDALGKLPEESLASAWIEGKPLVTAIQKEAQGADLGQASKLEWLAAALEARDDGAAIQAVVKGISANTESFESSLLDKVPSDTLLFTTFKSLDKSLGDIEKQAGPGGALIEGALGVKLRDLADLFSGETALWARAGTPAPEITLALDDTNAEAKLATLGKLARKVIALIPPSADFQPTGPRPVTIEGASMNELRFGPFAVYYGRANGWIVVTDTRNAIRDLRGADNSLADDPLFKETKDAAGMPDENAGFFYINLKDAIAEIAGLAGESIPADVQANLRPLRTLLLYSKVDGDVTGITAFLEIK